MVKFTRKKRDGLIFHEKRKEWSCAVDMQKLAMLTAGERQQAGWLVAWLARVACCRPNLPLKTHGSSLLYRASIRAPLYCLEHAPFRALRNRSVRKPSRLCSSPADSCLH
jgi:hypothetical protein